MFTPSPATRIRFQAGISMVELIMFIVIVGIAVAGILSVMNITTQHSADPMLRKQVIAIAESLLEEVTQMPFTFCDPDDPTAATATSAAVVAGGCTAQVENIGAEAAFAPYQTANEDRYSSSAPLDNVNDYNGFNMTGIADITGTAVPLLAGYNANIIVAQSPVGPAGTQVPAADSLLITVTVTPPTGAADAITLHGYRTRYAPNAVP